MPRRIDVIGLLLLSAFGCGREGVTNDSAMTAVPPSPIDSGFTSVSDSEWVEIKGPTLVGFYPIRTNDQLERDADLATALDDFSYHIGTAMDSLYAAGFTVHYRGGDTLWLRSATARWRFVRPADSADVGYVMADSARNMAVMYGVRTYVDLIEYAHEFKRTGQVRAR
ncbi:MAG TPA: hypothetical protein VF128_02645 [Gemmatimonadaceae bacterium]